MGKNRPTMGLEPIHQPPILLRDIPIDIKQTTCDLTPFTLNRGRGSCAFSVDKSVIFVENHAQQVTEFPIHTKYLIFADFRCYFKFVNKLLE